MTMIEQELGRPWQQVYAELTPRPIAAASLGQVSIPTTMHCMIRSKQSTYCILFGQKARPVASLQQVRLDTTVHFLIC